MPLENPPTVTWNQLAAGDTAAGTPVPPHLWIALRDDIELVRQWLVGKDGTFTADVPHTHTGRSGDDSAHPEPNDGHNLVINSLPYYGSAANNGVELWDWNEPVDTTTTVGFRFMAHRGGGFIQQELPPLEEPGGLFGHDGHPSVISLFGKAEATLTKGVLAFGLSDSNGWRVRGLVDYTDFSTSVWKRWWMLTRTGGDTRASTADFNLEDDIGSEREREESLEQRLGDTASGRGGAIALKVRAIEPFDSSVTISGISITLGRRLFPFYFSPLERSDHAAYARISSAVPVWSKSVSMTNAVRIYPS